MKKILLFTATVATTGACYVLWNTYVRMTRALKYRRQFSRRQLQLIEEADYCEQHGIKQLW